MKKIIATGFAALILTLTFAAQATAKNYRVSVFDGQKGTGVSATVNINGHTASGSSGQYTADINDASSVTFDINATGYYRYKQTRALTPNEQNNSDIQIGLRSSGGRASVPELLPASFIEDKEFNARFVVTDDATGAKLAGAHVLIQHYERDNAGAGNSDDKGIALVYTKPGHHSVTVTRPGYKKWQRRDIVLAEGVEIPVAMTALSAKSKPSITSPFVNSFVAPTQNPGGQEIPINFKVIAQDVAKARIPNAKITATDQNGTTKTCTTNTNGWCQIENLLQGRIRISATAEGFTKGSTARSVSKNEEVAITMYLPER